LTFAVKALKTPAAEDGKAAAAAADSKATVEAQTKALAALELGARPDTVLLDVAQLTRVFCGKQSQLLLNPIAQAAEEAHCFTLMGSKTLVCDGGAGGAASIALLLRALKHILPFNKLVITQEPLKDKFQPLRVSYLIAPYQPPRDSDDEEGEDDGGGGGGGCYPGGDGGTGG
jgi:hypothetical protein